MLKHNAANSDLISQIQLPFDENLMVFVSQVYSDVQERYVPSGDDEPTFERSNSPSSQRHEFITGISARGRYIDEVCLCILDVGKSTVMQLQWTPGKCIPKHASASRPTENSFKFRFRFRFKLRHVHLIVLLA